MVRDLPLALDRRGWQCTVMTPAYGIFNQIPGATSLGSVCVRFSGTKETVDVYRVPGDRGGVEYLALEHPLFSVCGAGRIYCDDPADRPFATDASKFALFSAAAAAFVNGLDKKPSVVHLNDWHAALFLLLRKFDPDMQALQNIRTVFTIHNLALQGIRPLADDVSSLQAWFPDLEYSKSLLSDSRYPDCINPMALAIRLADAVNTVSPNYMREVITPGHASGEGLGADLAQAARDQRLFGILNGCEYTAKKPIAPSWTRLRELLAQSLLQWMCRARTVHTTHFFAERKLARLPKRRPATIVSSVGRLTPQKARLFLEPGPRGQSALESILDALDDKSLLIMLGSGDPAIESELNRISVARDNFLLLNGFDEPLSQALFATGDLFLMPSTFEPCGISQMLAMRAGQPCVVNDVGGLHDTVIDGETGFVFRGDSVEQQAIKFVESVRSALQLRADDPQVYAALRRRAAAVRFSWDDSASHYERVLYVA